MLKKKKLDCFETRRGSVSQATLVASINSIAAATLPTLMGLFSRNLLAGPPPVLRAANHEKTGRARHRTHSMLDPGPCAISASIQRMVEKLLRLLYFTDVRAPGKRKQQTHDRGSVFKPSLHLQPSLLFASRAFRGKHELRNNGMGYDSEQVDRSDDSRAGQPQEKSESFASQHWKTQILDLVVGPSSSKKPSVRACEISRPSTASNAWTKFPHPDFQAQLNTMESLSNRIIICHSP